MTITATDSILMDGERFQDGKEKGHRNEDIAEEIMDKIFDPYFTTKGPQAGPGIGLFMSKTIIEKNMGGRLAARNIANGAEFRIELGDGIHI